MGLRLLSPQVKLCLKIICEAWLDHIYLKKVKFSYCGALNLLKDFDGVAEWINQCPAITDNQHRVQLAKQRYEVSSFCDDRFGMRIELNLYD